MANSFGTLAYKIWDGEFVEDETDQIHRRVQTDYISGWLEANIGTLNVLLDTSLSGTSPDFTIEQESIFYEMYMVRWYKKQARDTLKGIANSSDFIKLTNADGASIQRNNRSEAAKTYTSLAKDCSARLDDLVKKYKMFESKQVGPLQVAGYDNTYP